MRARAFLISGLMVAVTHCATVKASGVDVLSWALTTNVFVGNLNTGPYDTTVVNPLQHTYFASVQNSTAQSVINAAWDDAGNFDFLVEAELVEQGGDGNSASSVGAFELIPEVDSILTIDARYNYALGSGDRRTQFHLAVYQPDPGVSIYSLLERVYPIAGDPRVGTFADQTVVPLEAGIEYGIGYGLELYSYGGSPSSFSHGDGYASFHIQPVPEPSTAFLLVLAGALLVARRVPRARRAEVD